MTVGEALAEARSRAGLTVDDVSERTRIRETVIRCIEQDDYDECGGDIYVRGYVRAIAGAVGIDAKPLIREFDAARTNARTPDHAGAPGAEDKNATTATRGNDRADAPDAGGADTLGAPIADVAEDSRATQAAVPTDPPPADSADSADSAAAGTAPANAPSANAPSADAPSVDAASAPAGAALSADPAPTIIDPGFKAIDPALTLADQRFTFDPGLTLDPGFRLSDPALTIADPGFRLQEKQDNGYRSAGYAPMDQDPGYMAAEPVYRVADRTSAAGPTSAVNRASAADRKPTADRASAADQAFAADPPFDPDDAAFAGSPPWAIANLPFTGDLPADLPFTASNPLARPAADDTSSVFDLFLETPEQESPAPAPTYVPPANPSAWRGRTRSRRWMTGVFLLLAVAAAAAVIAGTQIIAGVRHGSAASESAANHTSQQRQAQPGPSGPSTAPGGTAAGTASASPEPTPTPTATASTPRTAKHPVSALPIRSMPIAVASAFGPDGTSDGDNPQHAMSAISPRPPEPWQSDWYATPDFGRLKDGTGLLFDMGKTVTITSVRMDLADFRGADLQLRAGGSAVLGEMKVVARASDAGGTVSLRLTAPVRARYVVIWFSLLPPNGQGTFQESVSHVVVFGHR